MIAMCLSFVLVASADFCTPCNTEMYYHCTGHVSQVELSHSYGFLWLNTCYYYQHTHNTIAVCPVCSTSRPTAQHTMETFHDSGCGRVNYPIPCPDWYPSGR